MNPDTAKKLLDKTLADMGYVEPTQSSSSRQPLYMSYSYDENKGSGEYTSAKPKSIYKVVSSNIEHEMKVLKKK